MITETREIYKCEYCKKMYQLKRFAEQHEKRCSKNPDNYRKCLDSCRNLKMEETTIYYDTYNSDGQRDVNLFFCEKINSFLFPPKVEYKGNSFELWDEDELNSPMKKECDFYADESIKELLSEILIK